MPERGPDALAALAVAIAIALAAPPTARAQVQAPGPAPADSSIIAGAPALHFSGDLGVGLTGTPDAAAPAGRRERPLPYAYGDLGPLFARVDTFGVRLVPMGAGSLELVARVSDEGREASPAQGPRRADPRPWGVGTFQETRWGGVFADAFVDLASGGRLLEASYVAELHLGGITWYPQAGLAHRDARYRAALYGRPDWHPGAATTPSLALSIEAPVATGWSLAAHVEREVAAAPAGRTRWLVALVRSFD